MNESQNRAKTARAAKETKGPPLGQRAEAAHQSLPSGTSLPPWSLGQRFVLVQAWKYQKYQKLKLSLFGRPQHKTNQHEPAINLN